MLFLKVYDNLAGETHAPDHASCAPGQQIVSSTAIGEAAGSPKGRGAQISYEKELTVSL